MCITDPRHARSRHPVSWLRLLAVLSVVSLVTLSPEANATASMDSCNNTSNECRARIATVYVDGGWAYVFLEGNLKPSLCTAAYYTYSWSMDLAGAGAEARLAMLLAAYAAGDAVELRTYSASCGLTAARLGV